MEFCDEKSLWWNMSPFKCPKYDWICQYEVLKQRMLHGREQVLRDAPFIVKFIQSLF
jgi:hypothetical protein